MTAKAAFNKITNIALVILIGVGSAGIISAKGLTAEAVLGDYRSDPLFGEAAANKSVIIEVGDYIIAPKNISVETMVNIRFVFTNSSKQTHLMVMANDINEVIKDQSFINAYLEHGESQVSVPGGHSHGNTSTEGSSPMVKLINEHPAVFINPGDTKEVLVRFEDTRIIQLACVLDDHHKQGVNGIVSPYINK